jgi:N-acetylneuraminate lyase/4-hydroxy-tetrahydrodipicolinate synthase
MFRPEGVYVPMLTPFEKDGRLNEKVLREITDFAIDAGVNGLFPVASAGEAVHLSFDEKVRSMQVVVDQVQGRVKVIPGVGSSYSGEAIQLAEKAAELGCDAIVIAPPYFYQMSQEMIESYFEAIIDASSLPSILYNIPLFTQPVSYDVIKRLSRREKVVGIKDSSGSMVDVVHFMDKVKIAGEDIVFLTGREETFFPCLMAGARGCMVATAGILPEVMVGIYDAWREGDFVRAKEIHDLLPNLVRAMFAMPFPLGFKTALELRGFDMGSIRPPLSNAEKYNCKMVRSRIEKILVPILKQIERAK